MRRESINVGPEQSAERPGVVWERTSGPVEFALQLGQPLTIGRGTSNTVVIDSAQVAESHVVIQFSSGQFLLENLDPVNAARVNGRPVAQCLLALGDVIEIGNGAAALF